MNVAASFAVAIVRGIIPNSFFKLGGLIYYFGLMIFCFFGLVGCKLFTPRLIFCSQFIYRIGIKLNAPIIVANVWA